MDVAEFIDLAVEIQMKDAYQRQWTEAEDDILRRLHGHLTDAEISKIIQRSENAVELRWKRNLHLPAPSRDPAYISTRKIAEALGIDEHKTPTWVDRGILIGEYVPRVDDQLWCRVRLDIFWEWLMDPMNWIWFNIHKVKDVMIREALEERQEEWGDEWWNTNQVAEYHHVNNKDVLRYIQIGRIKAVQARNRGGRDKGSWAFWFILRSEATRPDLVFKHNKNRPDYEKYWKIHSKKLANPNSQ